jgi:phage terminase large subunit-like protein
MAFNTDSALRVINFIELLKHTKGKFHGKQFKLLNWQHEALWDVYGNLKDDGNRQYQFLYMEIPKKNGKTELAAGLGIYHTFADNEIKGEVYGCAADRAQASMAFDVAVDMIDQCPPLKKQCKYTASKKRLEDIRTGTIYQVLSAEAFTKHGLNSSAVIFDELHAQPNRELWDVMTFGAGDARAQPIWIVITTAGDDPDKVSIGYEIHEYARKIIDGEITDPRWYAKIYNAPVDADIWSEDVWYKANPSLGQTIQIETVRQAAIAAKNDPAQEKLFRWLRLNQWVSLKTTSWLPLTLWDSSEGEWSRADLVGKKCYAGLDLSSTTDITAVALLFPPQDGIDEWRAIFEAWVPEENMKKRVREDHVPYDIWIKNKHMDVTPGDVIDYDFIKARILTLSEQYDIEAVGCDPWNATQLMIDLEKDGVNTIEVRQNMATMSPAMKFFESAIKSNNFTHENNPAARWCFGNITVYMDGNENMKPKKASRKERMDIIIALIDAFYVGHKLYNPCSYDARPVGEKLFVV